MKKSEFVEMFNKFIESIPDNETESVISTEEVETVENTVETESTGGTETVEEEKRIYVTETGEYDYR